MQVMVEQAVKVTTTENPGKNTSSQRVGTGSQRIDRHYPKTRDISSIYAGTTMDSVNAFKGQGKNAKDIQETAMNTDVQALHDKMVVMSHCVSSEEFGEMMKDGFSPESMDVEEYITIVDRIKVEEARSGKVIAGYNDDLKDEVLKEVTGSESGAAVIRDEIKKEAITAEEDGSDVTKEKQKNASGKEQETEQMIRENLEKRQLPATKESVQSMKQTVVMAEQLSEISPATKKYLVENAMRPSVENIYTAQYSGSMSGKQANGYFEQDGTGYLAAKSDEVTSGELDEQIRQLFEAEDIEFSEEAFQNAKWLIAEGIPVTAENVELAMQIDQIQLPKSKESWVDFVVDASQEGYQPKKAEVGPIIPRQEEAQIYMERFAKISEEAVQQTVDLQQKLDLVHLERQEKEISLTDRTQGLSTEMSQEALKAYRQLEEIRLHMTADVCVRLLRNGIEIDTTELSELVDRLKETELELAKSLFPQEEDAVALEKNQLYEKSKEIVEALPQMPVAMVGLAIRKGNDASLSDYYEEGKQQTLSYEAAKKSYETFLTVARGDLGDSIKKAFRNLPQILEEAGIEDTEENERAARILAYNHLEIDEESVATIRNADISLQYAAKELNPAMILSIIRDGENPMEMTLEQLVEQIEQYNQKEDQEIKRFSEFLYELDQKKEITQEERKSFLEVYRVFHQLDKTDGAAIGSLLHQGADLTLQNLKMATKTAKKQIDYTLSDTEILKNQFTKDAKLVSHSLQVKDLQQFQDLEQVELQQLKQATDSGRETNESYVRKQMQEFVEACNVSEEAFEKVMESEVPVTSEYLLAQEKMLQKRGSLYQELERLMPNILREQMEAVTEQFTGEEPVEAAYDQMLRDMSQQMMEQVQQADSYIDLKAINQVMKQISLVRAAKENHEYEVPVRIGEELVSVHVTMQESKDGKGNVAVTCNSETYGELGAVFEGTAEAMTGYLAAQTQEGQAFLEGHLEAFLQRLSNAEINCGRIRVVHSPGMELSKIEENARQTTESKKECSGTYFQVAKAFIKAVSETDTIDLARKTEQGGAS